MNRGLNHTLVSVPKRVTLVRICLIPGNYSLSWSLVQTAKYKQLNSSTKDFTSVRIAQGTHTGEVKCHTKESKSDILSLMVSIQAYTKFIRNPATTAPGK